MSKAGERILKSVRRARAFVHVEDTEGFVVHVPKGANMRTIRRGLNLKHEGFVARFGFAKGHKEE